MEIHQLHAKLSNIVIEELIKAGHTRMGREETLRVDASAIKVSNVVEKVLEKYIPLLSVTAKIPLDPHNFSKESPEVKSKEATKAVVKSCLKTYNSDCVFIYDNFKDLEPNVFQEVIAVSPIVKVADIFALENPKENKTNEQLN